MTIHSEVPPGSEALIVKHMALVGHIVRETLARVPAHVDRDDLTSAGLAALVQAAHAVAFIAECEGWSVVANARWRYPFADTGIGQTLQPIGLIAECPVDLFDAALVLGGHVE